MNILATVKRRKSLFILISVVLNVLIFSDILNKYKDNVVMEVTLSAGLFLFCINNYVRKKYLLIKKDVWYTFSYILSVIVLGVLTTILASLNTSIYNIILLIEIIVVISKVNYVLLISNLVIYVVSNFLSYVWLYKGSELGVLVNILINFFSPCLILFLFQTIVLEKSRYEILNNELKEANLTLKTYADEIEDLTKIRERNRIAQELHDSMGHSLMALKMYLEYAENILESNSEKSKEVIHKTQSMAKDCIDNLRKAVSLLKAPPSIELLRAAILDLFQNFKETGSLRFHLDMDDSVERAPTGIKSCIYKIIREAITNGIKHGNATIFQITVKDLHDCYCLTIGNNGLVCNTIIKSNGIIGMEEGLKTLGGTINFSSSDSFGLIIEAVIPLYLHDD
jgi:signal transduction histidine kinase